MPKHGTAAYWKDYAKRDLPAWMRATYKGATKDAEPMVTISLRDGRRKTMTILEAANLAGD